GASAESPSACLILLTAELIPVSTSTNTSALHNRATISARDTSSPRHSISRISRSICWRVSLRGRPPRRSSYAPRSSSNSPKQKVSRRGDVMVEDACDATWQDRASSPHQIWIESEKRDLLRRRGQFVHKARFRIPRLA